MEPFTSNYPGAEPVPREDWLAERRRGIGASDAAAILGVSPYKTAYQVWVDKLGLLPGDALADKEFIQWGNILEGPIAEEFARRTGRIVSRWIPGRSEQHPKYDWLRCTPDAVQTRTVDGLQVTGLLQIKTTNAFGLAEWRDGPPLAYQVQIQHEMEVMGAEWGTVCCLVGGQKLVWHDVVANPAFVAAMLPKLAEFWQLVVSRTPPPIDGSDEMAQILARLHPDDSGATVVLPQESGEWAEEIETCKAKIKELEKRQTLAENQLKAAIGDATYGLTSDGARWSWKTQERSGYTVGPAKFRVLRKTKG